MSLVSNRLPVRVGRGAENELRLEDDGVWDSHASIDATPNGFFRLVALKEAIVYLNGEPVKDERIKVGDMIELGRARICFQLPPSRPRGLAFREFILWTAMLLLILGELILMFWLG